ncbi:MAG: SurA N-terminal domain-containing protein [Pseudomonadota bacterium]
MLTEIRDRSSGVFAYFIAALIIVPMAFWGVQEYANTNATPTILSIGDTKISQQDFQQQLRVAQDRERQRNPNLTSNEFFNSDFFKRRVLDSLVNRALVENIANEQNYRIGNAQLADIIKEQPVFQTPEGEFDRQAYDDFVQSRLASKQQFEDGLRDDARTQQVSEGYQESAFALSDDVRQLIEIQAERRIFDLITIKEADFREGIEVSDQDVSDYYDENIDLYMNPDRMSVEYVELDVAQLALEVEIDEDELLAAYEDDKDSFTSAETRDTRHILLSTGDGKNDADQRAKAESLVAELRAGADFASVATTQSDDTGSAARGGDLGAVELGMMVPEFEEATFAAEVGQISDPVKTQFGYHIIEVTAINGGVPQSFEEVRFELEQEQRDVLAEELLADRLEEMRNLVFETEDSLAEVAASLNTTVNTSSLFDREAGEGIASNTSIREAAFSPTVLDDNLNSDPIEIADGVFVALRKSDFQPAAAKPLDEVSTQISASLVNQRAAEAAEAAIESLKERAQQSWTEIAQDASVEIKEFDVALADSDLPVARNVIDKASSMRLDEGQPTVETLTSANGDFYVIRLKTVSEGDLATVSEQVKEATRRLVEARNGASLFTTYIDSLNQAATIGLDEELL